MNQVAPILSFETGIERFPFEISSKSHSFSKQLRGLAAHFQMHYALVHRLGPPGIALKNTTYVSILRNLEASQWCLGDLIHPSALETLFAGNRAAVWQHGNAYVPPQQDPLSRLDLRCGISVPFHNALGNHVALTLCDSIMPDINVAEFTLLAIPLIEAILATERTKNAASTSLSNRETHCLQWAAAGKTSIETGIILGLSPHTVNQYLTSATTKLKAVNRTHAVTKAVRFGLINLSGV